MLITVLAIAFRDQSMRQGNVLTSQIILLSEAGEKHSEKTAITCARRNGFAGGVRHVGTAA